MFKKSLKCIALVLALLLATVFSFKELLSVKDASALVGELPSPRALLDKSAVLDYPALAGLKLDVSDPMHLEFILEGSDSKEFDSEYRDMLINIFLSAVTIPKEKFWVNLSPNEENRILDDSLAHTDSGRLFLEQDYVLKLFSSSLSAPSNIVGREFWNKINNDSKSQLNELNMFNKFWVIPKQAKLARISNTVLIDSAELSVEQRQISKDTQIYEAANELLREHIENEVNYAENFALLRSFYRSFLLGLWYKDQLKATVLQAYVDQQKIRGIDSQDPKLKDAIFKKYLDSVEVGVYKKTINVSESKKRVYCAGGFGFEQASYDEQELDEYDALKKIKTIASPMSISVNLLALKNESSISSSVEKTITTNSPRILLHEFTKSMELVLASELFDDETAERYRSNMEYIAENKSSVMANIFSQGDEDAGVELSYINWAIESDYMPAKERINYLEEKIDNFMLNTLKISTVSEVETTSEDISLAEEETPAPSIPVKVNTETKGTNEYAQDEKAGLGKTLFNVIKTLPNIVRDFISKSIRSLLPEKRIQLNYESIKKHSHSIFLMAEFVLAGKCFIEGKVGAGTLFVIFGLIGLFRKVKGEQPLSTLSPKKFRQSPMALLFESNTDKTLDTIWLDTKIATNYISIAEYENYDYKTDDFVQSDKDLEINSLPLRSGNYDSFNKVQLMLSIMEDDIIKDKVRKYTGDGIPNLNRFGYLQTIEYSYQALSTTKDHYVVPMPIFENNYYAIPLGISSKRIPYFIKGGCIYFDRKTIDENVFNKSKGDSLSFEFAGMPQSKLQGEVAETLDKLKKEMPELFEQDPVVTEDDTNYDLGPIDKKIEELKKYDLPEHLLVKELETFIKEYLYYAKGARDAWYISQSPAKYAYQTTLKSRRAVCHDASKLLFMALKKMGVAVKYVQGRRVNKGKISATGHAFIKYWSKAQKRWLVSDPTPSKKFDYEAKEESIDESELKPYLDPRFVFNHIYGAASEIAKLTNVEQSVSSESSIVKVTVPTLPFEVHNDDSINIPISSEHGTLFYDKKGNLYIKKDENQYSDKVKLNFLSVKKTDYIKHSYFRQISGFNRDYFEVRDVEENEYLQEFKKLEPVLEFGEKSLKIIDQMSKLNISNSEMLDLALEFLRANFVFVDGLTAERELRTKVNKSLHKVMLIKLSNMLGVPIRGFNFDTIEFYDDELKRWSNKKIDTPLVEDIESQIDKEANLSFKLKVLSYSDEEIDDLLNELFVLNKKLSVYGISDKKLDAVAIDQPLDRDYVFEALSANKNYLSEMEAKVDEIVMPFGSFLKESISGLSEDLLYAFIKKIDLKVKDFEEYTVTGTRYNSLSAKLTINREKLVEEAVGWLIFRKLPENIYINSEYDDNTLLKLLKSKVESGEFEEYFEDIIATLIGEQVDYGPVTDEWKKKINNLMNMKKLQGFKKVDYFGTKVTVAATEDDKVWKKVMDKMEQDRVSATASSNVGGLDFSAANYNSSNSAYAGRDYSWIDLPKNFEGFTYNVSKTSKLDNPTKINFFLIDSNY